jgi:hypothetical protein
MKIISHRGNLTGPEEQYENHPDRIDYCISLGLDVEVDVWDLNGQWFLGHDYPQRKINFEFLEERKDNLWIHCKNAKVMEYFFNRKFQGNYFWHETDKYTITSKGYIWTYPTEHYTETYQNQIILDFNNISKEKFEQYQNTNIFALCLDYINI